MTQPEPKKELLLTIAVPGVWADDLDETAVEYYAGDRLEYVLDRDGMGLDPKVHITIVTIGDESGPVVFSYDCTVVGAATRDRA